MEKNLDPYERWHLEKYKCMPNGGRKPLHDEEFENGEIERQRETDKFEQECQWHNESPF